MQKLSGQSQPQPAQPQPPNADPPEPAKFVDASGNPIPLPVETWNDVPPAAKALILELMARIAVLEERLRTNSTNSSKPSSSDPPGTRREKKPGSGRRRGAQVGHKGHFRKLLPVAEGE